MKQICILTKNNRLIIYLTIKYFNDIKNKLFNKMKQIYKIETSFAFLP